MSGMKKAGSLLNWSVEGRTQLCCLMKSRRPIRTYFNVLLQVLDEGVITDNLGRKVDFKNTVIIMTSNVGTRFIDNATPLGFQQESAENSYGKIKSAVLDELKVKFNPEFLNRIDEIVVFHQLEKLHLVNIVKLLVDELNKELLDQDLAIELSDDVIGWIIDKNYQPSYGARPMRRAIQRHIEDPLSEEILRGRFKDIKKASVVLENDKIVFIESDVEALISSNN